MYFSLKVITPLGQKFNDEVTAVMAPGSDGYLGVLSGHAPMMSGLQTGVLTITSDDGPKYFAIREGVLEVHDYNEVDILCDRAIEAETLEAAEKQVAEFKKPAPPKVK